MNEDDYKDRSLKIFYVILGFFSTITGIVTVVTKHFSSNKLNADFHGSWAVFIGCLLILVGALFFSQSFINKNK